MIYCGKSQLEERISPILRLNKSWRRLGPGVNKRAQGGDPSSRGWTHPPKKHAHQPLKPDLPAHAACPFPHCEMMDIFTVPTNSQHICWPYRRNYGETLIANCFVLANSERRNWKQYETESAALMSSVCRLLFMVLFELDMETYCASSTYLQAKQVADKTRFYHVNCWRSRNNLVKCHTKTRHTSEKEGRKLDV